MLLDGLKLTEGSAADNLNIASGLVFPDTASIGELFLKINAGFAIGRCSSYYTPMFYGQIDMPRVTIGHPRYTTAFTPSTTYL